MTFAEQYPFINLGKRIEEGRRIVESGFTLHQGPTRLKKETISPQLIRPLKRLEKGSFLHFFCLKMGMTTSFHAFCKILNFQNMMA